MLVGVALVRSHQRTVVMPGVEPFPGRQTRCPRGPAPRPSAPRCRRSVPRRAREHPTGAGEDLDRGWWSSTFPTVCVHGRCAPRRTKRGPGARSSLRGLSGARGVVCLSGPAVLTGLRQGSGVPPRTGRDSARAPCPRRYSPRRALTATRTNAATPPTAQPATAQIGPLATNAAMTPARVRANQRPMAAGSSSARRTRASSRSEQRRLVTLLRRRPASRSAPGRPDR